MKIITHVTVNGKRVSVAAGTTVAAAVAVSGSANMRTSVNGQPRGALCGMGICFECRITINGNPNQRGCQTLCTDRMEICTT